MGFLSASRSNETLSASSAAVSTGTGTAAQDLATFSLPAGALKRDGQSVRITAFGTTAANGNNKTVALSFGSTTLVTSGALAANAKPWRLEAVVSRTSATTQQATGGGQANGAIIAESAPAPTETLSSAVSIKMTATDGTSSAGDVTLNGLLIEGLSE